MTTRKILLAITLAAAIACAADDDSPQGTRLADGSIRGGRDTVWVQGNNGDWLLYYMMLNGGRPYFQPAPQIITYQHVVSGTYRTAPPRPLTAQRPLYRSPAAMQPWSASRGFSSAASGTTYRSSTGSATYRPSTVRTNPSTSTYRPSTGTSTTRSYSAPSTYRSYSAPSSRVR